MITTTIVEKSDINKFKTIYYKGLNGILRKVQVDDFGRILRDYLYDYDEENRIDNIVIYGNDHVEILATKEFCYYQNSTRIKKTKQYKFESGVKLLTQKAEHRYDDENGTSTVVLYKDSDVPVGRMLYGYKNDEEFMSLIGCFDEHGNKVSFFDLGLEKIF